MGKITDFLAGIKVVEEVDSPINGKVTVIKSLAFGTYIQVSGLTQSGGIIKIIWNKMFSRIKKPVMDYKTCLILGLGGGSLVEVVGKHFPGISITAVDIDPLMVKLGKKYLELSESKAKIVIADAMEYAKRKSLRKKYDMVLVDLYFGDVFPEKFEKKEFAQAVLQLLTDEGIAVFNRLYYGEKRAQAVKFLKTLESVFPKVVTVYPEANVMYVCYPK